MKIWLIEDSDVYRKVLGRLLETCTPYTISREFHDESTISGLMEELNSERADLPDLFLMDLYLPNIDGWDILDKLTKFGIKKPVIIISQSNRQEDIERSKSYPNVTGYFVKSDFPANLFSMISELDSNN